MGARIAGGILAVATVSLSCDYAELAAQSRGELQVTARVLSAPANPRIVADLLRADAVRRQAGLYSMTSEVVRDIRREEGVARPRRVVTINYLGN